MNKALVVALSLVSTSGFAQQAKNFTLNGTLKNFPANVEKVYLSYRANGINVADSAVPTGGKYTFKGTIEEPIRAQLRVLSQSPIAARPSRKDFASVFLMPGNIEATSVDSFSNITIKGSAAQDEFAKIEAAMKPLEDKATQLNNQYMEFDKQKDEAGKNRIMTEFKALDKQEKEVYKKYVLTHPASPIAIYALNQFAGYDVNADEVDPVFKKLPASLKNYPSYKELSDRLVIARKLKIGRPAIDFTQNDTLGNPVSLASFKGKYVLVDFWASWCGPCRRENPNVVTAFNKYKDKGFTVLGVSLDQPGAQAKWLKAIHDDNLTWTHVSDLQFWNNAVAKAYGVRAIPFNILLDKQGNIVARNIRGEDLQNKLAEIFQ